MKIGVNLTPLRLGRAGGIKQLVFSLLTSLLEQNSDESYIYYINRSLRNIFASYNDRIRVVELPLATKEIGLRGTYGEYDVLYAPITDIGMQTASVPTVNLIVDLQHNAFPDFFLEMKSSHAVCLGNGVQERVSRSVSFQILLLIQLFPIWALSVPVLS